MNCTKIKQYIADNVGNKRIAHLYATAQQTQLLVERFIPTITPQTGYLVGLWHDAAREWPLSNLLDFCLTHQIAMEEEERIYPLLLHGPVAAYLLPQMVTVPSFCQIAIRWHTLGSPAMGALGAALYIADYIEPFRRYLTQEERQSLLQCNSLEEMCLKIVKRNQRYLMQQGLHMAATTTALAEFLAEGGEFTP